jgi:phosphopantetheine--protein transferase-like protein
MDDGAALRSLVASMLGLPVQSLDESTSLQRLEGSLGATRLRLGLKRIGMRLPTSTVPATYGQLEHALHNGQEPQTPAKAETVKLAPAPLEAPSSRIGHDIQDVASLPDANDYWTHDFYCGSFSHVELAYAVVTPNPKEHFAGFWTAKEALKKCEASFMDLELSQVTVAHDAAGRPYFVLSTPAGAIRLGHELSISHAGNFASAVVLSPRTER